MNITDIYQNNHFGAGFSRLCSLLYLAGLTVSFGLVGAMALPSFAHAGGYEFAARGTRGLGRGGASFLRADDPNVMITNPALLADLPDDMAMAGGLLAYPNACYRPSGAFSWAANPASDVIMLDEAEGPLYLGAEEGDVNAATGQKLTSYKDEPFPKSCYEGGMRPFPAVALSVKIGEKLGLGLGFLPPDSTLTDVWGNGDGTIDTPKGKRPDITAYTMAPNDLTYFGLIAAAGYRIAPWLRFGAGFRWTMVIIDSANYANIEKNMLSPTNALRATVYGKDLFIPGFNASIHAVPFDALDVALGFRWEDRTRFNDFKLDALARPFNNGEDLTINRADGTTETIQNFPGYTINNIPGKFEAPPPVVPQITFGIRFADRIRPRNYQARKKVTEDLRDSMNDERWDIEANAIYYFNSVNDQQVFSNDGSVVLKFAEKTPLGDTTINQFPLGPCVKYAADGSACTRREVVTKLGGKDQIGLRLGGDLNIFPGLLSLRAGASWDSRGLNPDYASVQNLNFQRLGLHAGMTIRIAKNTDISLAIAHFFFETIEVQLNNEDNATIPNLYKYASTPEKAKEYNIKAEFDQSGKPVTDANGSPVLSKLDGVARATYTSNEIRSWPYVNAGTYTYQMTVLGLTLAQHF